MDKINQTGWMKVYMANKIVFDGCLMTNTTAVSAVDTDFTNANTSGLELHGGNMALVR